jgi:hypothetical protein
LHVYTDTGALIFASTEDLLRAALREAGIAGGKIVEFPNAMICRLMIVKGEVRAAFERLKIRKRPTQPGKEKAKKTKKQQPVKNEHPPTGMPVNQPTFPTLEAWHQWKKQGRELEELLSATLKNVNKGDTKVNGIKFHCCLCLRKPEARPL